MNAATALGHSSANVPLDLSWLQMESTVQMWMNVRSLEVDVSISVRILTVASSVDVHLVSICTLMESPAFKPLMVVMVTMEAVNISASVITIDALSVAVDLDIDWMTTAEHVKN